MYRSKWRW